MSSNHVDLCFERKTFRDPFVSREIHDLYFCILSKYSKKCSRYKCTGENLTKYTNHSHCRRIYAMCTVAQVTA